MTRQTFRCPRNGNEVPVPFSPDPTADPNTYEYVECPACSRSHLVNKSTGRLLGDKVRPSQLAASSYFGPRMLSVFEGSCPHLNRAAS